MKGYLILRVKPQKDGCVIKGKVDLKQVRQMDKFHMMELFLQELEITTEDARLFLDIVDRKKEVHNNAE